MPLRAVPALIGAPDLSISRVLRLLAVVSTPPSGSRWPRSTAGVTLQQLVGLRAAFALAGGVHAMKGRLRIAKLRRVIRQFEAVYGIASPLTTVRFQRLDRVIVAYLDGVHLEPETGQALLELAAAPHASGELVEHVETLRRLAAAAPVPPSKDERALPVLVPRSWKRNSGRRNAP